MSTPSSPPAADALSVPSATDQLPQAKRSDGTATERRQRGAVLLEVVVSATLGSLVLLGAVGAWGALSRWSADLEQRAVLLREARAARDYLERDVFEYQVVRQSNPNRLLLVKKKGKKGWGAKGRRTIVYRQKGDGLIRDVKHGNETLVANHVSSASFDLDPKSKRLEVKLVFGESLELLLAFQETTSPKKDKGGEGGKGGNGGKGGKEDDSDTKGQGHGKWKAEDEDSIEPQGLFAGEDVDE